MARVRSIDLTFLVSNTTSCLGPNIHAGVLPTNFRRHKELMEWIDLY